MSNIKILKLLNGNAFEITYMTKKELEQIAKVMGVTITWRNDNE